MSTLRPRRATVHVAVLGDRDRTFAPHRATDAALAHAAAAHALDVCARWVSTEAVGMDAAATLGAFDAVWVAPGSPYRSLDGALRAIRYARELGVPLLGTCGGFQHVVLEYARHVMRFDDAHHAEYEPYASRLFVTPLSCSLVGQAMAVRLDPASHTAAWYRQPAVTEQYYCNFGLNPAYESALHAAGLRIVGRDAAGEARVVELPGHPFFVATLFVPQLGSAPECPHPLVVAFVQAARRHAEAYAAHAAAPIARSSE